MTRKDYIEVADIFNSYKDEISENTLKAMLSDFNYFFKSDNSNFNAEKFLDAVMK